MHYFIGKFNFKKERIKIVDKELLHQFNNVLRFNKGEKILLGNGKNREALAIIEKINKDFAVLKTLNLKKSTEEPHKEVSLYCSILKRENFEFVCQKATEIGIKEIFPIICERTVKLGFKKERLEKIIKEASEQSKRGEVPKLNIPLIFLKAIENARENEVNVLFDILGSPIKGILPFGFKKVGVFIGPEGGFSQKEIDLVRKSNFKILNLGKLTLRAETAAVVGCWLTVNL